MLQVEGKKMSKSLGNFFTVRDLLGQGVPGEVIRFVMLSTHYRKPMDWTEKKREEATRRLAAWFRKTEGVEPAKVVPARVLDALADDLNTHLALDRDELPLAPYLKAAMQLVGFPDAEEVEWFRDTTGADVDDALAARIDALLARRTAAKAERNFAEADRIRDALTRAGVVVTDTPGGSVGNSGQGPTPPRWRRSNDPRPPLPLRHHAPRRAADAGRAVLPRRKAPHRGDASTPSGSTTSKAAGRARTRPTANSSPTRRRPAPPSPPSA